MLVKWFLVGWICLGQGTEQKCVRMGSEIVNDSYETCNQYFQILREEFSDVETLKMHFTCVNAGLLEDFY